MGGSGATSKLGITVGGLMLLVGVAKFAKYSIQRLATAVGIFGRAAGEDTVALRLDPCP